MPSRRARAAARRARVTSRDELRSALEDFVKYDGPAFLEVITDQNAHVYPMIGPGMGYKDMITGKYITPRSEKDVIVDKNAGF